MDWLTRIRNAEKTALIQDGKRKVHYKFNDGNEMAEEYNINTGILVRRAWKKSGRLTSAREWEIEVGDPEPAINVSDIGIKENADSPYIVKRITKLNVEWRIRNLPFDVSTYSVTADPVKKCLVVRTTNKKYYKEIRVEELERSNVPPEQKNISFTHKYNTLIITYKKPDEVLKLEEETQEMVKRLNAITNDDELPCKPS